MEEEEIEYIKSCASLLQQSNDTDQIIEILERLQEVSMSIDTLKSTRIGAIVNKLTKRSDLPDVIHTFAWKLVSDWKEIATASVKEEKYTNTTTTTIDNIPSYLPSTHHSPHTQTPPNVSPLSSPSSSPYPPRNRRKRRLSSIQDPNHNDTSDTNSNINSNSNSSSNHNKRQRLNNTNPGNSMFALGNKKKVPSLQQLCIKVMKQNAMSIGKLPCELDGKLVQQIYGSLKPSELKRIYKLNPHIRQHLDALWRRQLINLNPNYVKRDDTMSWYKAYQLYLIERKDKLESAKRKLILKTEEAKFDKQGATIFNKDEATIFKQRVNRAHRNRKYRANVATQRKNRMMKDCMDFVNQRKRMFAGAAVMNNRHKQAAYNKKQSFVKRQKQLREQKKADRNRLCQW